MSYDSDFESVYMVEFESGRIIHMQRFDIQEVKEDCKDEYVGEVIKTIYKEVYVNVGDNEEEE
jgi:phospholipid N-methyltransferase